MRLWRRGLWKLHAALFIGILIVEILLRNQKQTLTFTTIATGLAIGSLPIMLLWLFPILRFKRQTRTLTIDAMGLETTIGSKHGTRTWSEIRSIAELDGDIVLLGKNGNAFVIPPRAFKSATAREGFLNFAMSAHRSVPRPSVA